MSPRQARISARFIIREKIEALNADIRRYQDHGKSLIEGGVFSSREDLKKTLEGIAYERNRLEFVLSDQKAIRAYANALFGLNYGTEEPEEQEGLLEDSQKRQTSPHEEGPPTIN